MRRLYPVFPRVCYHFRYHLQWSEIPRPGIIATPSENAEEMTIVVNGETLALANVDGVRRIDCLAQEISNAAQTALYTVNSAGPFPVLRPGNNSIGGEGWSELQIYKRERFL